jgi:predicted ATPase/DNA-binding SARP family transcriptional activator
VNVASNGRAETPAVEVAECTSERIKLNVPLATVCVLGTTELRIEGQLVPLRSKLQRRLVSILAIRGGVPVSIEELVDAQWPDGAVSSARASLQNQISRLRGLLGGGLLTTPNGYRFEEQLVDVDIRQFDAWSSTTLGALVTDRISVLDSALAHVRGRPLVEFENEVWAVGEAVRLREAIVVAQYRRALAFIEAGRYSHAVAEAASLHATHGGRSDTTEVLMRALAATGRAREALNVYGAFRRELVELSGLEPSAALRSLADEILLATSETQSESAGPDSPTRDPLFPSRSFIGRVAERATLMQLVAEHSVVSVVGPGGVGKSALAIAVAAELAVYFADGVTLVSMAEVESPELLIDVLAERLNVAGALSRSDAATLARSLTKRHTLIILDSCERFVYEIGLIVAAIKAVCPSVHLLVSSRSPLGLRDEHVLRVGPLGLSDAVLLFNERAGDAGFVAIAKEVPATSGDDMAGSRTSSLIDLGPGSGASRNSTNFDGIDPVVARICERLDCLPLAIELAAAQLGALSVDELLVDLHDGIDSLSSFSLDRPEHHRTLRACISWSWDRLSDVERKVLRRLTVFEGGFTLSAAVAIVSDQTLTETKTRTLVRALIEKSMLYRRGGGDRLEMLDTVREFCAEQLHASENAEEVRRRHGNWIAGQLELIVDLMHDSREVTAADQRDSDSANIRACVVYASKSGDLDLLSRLSAIALETCVLGQLAPWQIPSPATMLLHLSEAETGKHTSHHLYYLATALRVAQGGAHWDGLVADWNLVKEHPIFTARIVFNVTYQLVMFGMLQGRALDDREALVNELASLESARTNPDLVVLTLAARASILPQGCEAALELLNDALDAATATGSPSLIGRVALLSALQVHFVGRDSEAREFFQRAERAATLVRNPLLQKLVLGVRPLVQSDDSRVEAMITTLEDALGVGATMVSLSAIGSCIALMADLGRMRGASVLKSAWLARFNWPSAPEVWGHDRVVVDPWAQSIGAGLSVEQTLAYAIAELRRL